MLLTPLTIILKIFQKLRIYQIRLTRYLLINEYKHLSNHRIKINSDYLFDSNFNIELDGSNSEVSIGKDVVFRENGRITCFNNGKIQIKDSVYFNRNCSLNCLLAVDIDSYCLFGENVKIYDHNHNFNDQEKLIKEQGYSKARIKIGKNCWIGSNTIILKGVTIGDNVVIGANNLIVKDIPSNTIVKSNIGLGSITTKENENKRNSHRFAHNKKYN
jgi:acetyltransferase-like isoleucine patch superfamily enzyme